jgi:hypothetical protein
VLQTNQIIGETRLLTQEERIIIENINENRRNDHVDFSKLVIFFVVAINFIPQLTDLFSIDTSINIVNTIIAIINLVLIFDLSLDTFIDIFVELYLTSLSLMNIFINFTNNFRKVMTAYWILIKECAENKINQENNLYLAISNVENVLQLRRNLQLNNIHIGQLNYFIYFERAIYKIMNLLCQEIMINKNSCDLDKIQQIVLELCYMFYQNHHKSHNKIADCLEIIRFMNKINSYIKRLNQISPIPVQQLQKDNQEKLFIAKQLLKISTEILQHKISYNPKDAHRA